MLAVSPLLDALQALTLALCRQSFAFIGHQVAPRLLSLALRESSLALFQRSGAPIQVVWIGRLLVTGHAPTLTLSGADQHP